MYVPSYFSSLFFFLSLSLSLASHRSNVCLPLCFFLSLPLSLLPSLPFPCTLPFPSLSPSSFSISFSSYLASHHLTFHRSSPFVFFFPFLPFSYHNVKHCTSSNFLAIHLSDSSHSCCHLVHSWFNLSFSLHTDANVSSIWLSFSSSLAVPSCFWCNSVSCCWSFLIDLFLIK